MSEVFAWKPTTATLRRKPRVTVAKFGDGYEQRTADGIHADLQAWEVAFTGLRPDVALAIDDFLSSRGAAEAFSFTTKRGETLLCVCRSWAVADAPQQSVDVSATFEQVPA